MNPSWFQVSQKRNKSNTVGFLLSQKPAQSINFPLEVGIVSTTRRQRYRFFKSGFLKVYSTFCKASKWLNWKEFVCIVQGALGRGGLSVAF